MKTTTVVALSLLLSFMTINTTHAQEEDPLDGFGDILDAFSELAEEGSSELESTDSSSSSEDSSTSSESTSTDSTSTEESESESSSTESTSTENTSTTESTTTTDTTSADYTTTKSNVNPRYLVPTTIPEGKENFVLYRVPGAIELNGSTFLNIKSSKFYNRYQRCNMAETEVVNDRLARLKISQGGPLACREDMEYRFQPYKTYGSNR